jgi:NTE family protein
MRLDLVLEGGGVKGIALVGALSVLEERGFEFHRVAGASAGAIVGSLVAAKMDTKTMAGIVDSIDYRKFKDATFLSHFSLVGEGASFLLEKGVYKGDAVEKWIAEQLGSCHVSTFAQLADVDDDPGSTSADASKAYRLIVTSSDVTNGRLALLPWDFATEYPTSAPGGGASERSVSEAVRCSMSIPFFYEPHQLDYQGGPDLDQQRTALMVDGGMLSNFPVQVFDRTDAKPPRWPTFGIKLSSRPSDVVPPKPIDGPFEFAKSLITTMMGFSDRAHIEDPTVLARTIFVDTLGVSATEFDRVSKDAGLRKALFASGQSAATAFLDGDGTPQHPPWTFERYITDTATNV